MQVTAEMMAKATGSELVRLMTVFAREERARIQAGKAKPMGNFIYSVEAK